MEQNNSEKPQEIANNKMGTADNAAENPQTEGNINTSEKSAVDNSVNKEEKSSENKKSESPEAQETAHTAATAMSESMPMSGISGKRIFKTLFKNVVLLSLSSVFALTIFFIYKISADSGNNIIAMIRTGEFYENAVMIFLPQNSGLAEEYRRKAVERYIAEDKEKQDRLIKSITDNVLKLSGYNQNVPANITTIEEAEKYLGIFPDSYKANSEKDKLLAQKAQLANAEEKGHCKKDIERLENDLKNDDSNTFLQFQLGMLYDPYRMQECSEYKDVNKTKDIYLKAAKKGNSYAQKNLAEIFYFQEKNEKEAFQWHKKAAENGNRFSQWKLALYYVKAVGNSLPFYLKWKNEEPYRREKAEYWFRRAAAQGYKDAYVGLGALYAKDYISYIKDGKTNFNSVEAEKWLIKAAQTGDTLSMSSLGQIYLDGVLGNYIQAEIGLHYLKTAADKGDESAELYLANKYLYGYPPFIKKDAEIAKQIFHKLEKSESFQKSAKRGLAGLYLSEKNYRESYKYRKQLIEKFEDYDELEFLFSTIYMHGIKDDKDFKKQILDFVISEVDKGHYPKDVKIKGLLLQALAYLYKQGDDIVNRDYQEYKKYLIGWTQLGHPTPLIHLGEIYENGLGVEKNFDEAESYYKTAAKQNSADALFHLANLHYNKAVSMKEDSSDEFKTVIDYLNNSLKIKDNSEANSLMGLMYYNGYGVKQDYAKAISFFRKAKKKDLGGIIFSYNKEKENSYMKICANTEAKAQCLLGKSYPEIASAQGFADYFVREHNESIINYLKEQIAKGNEKAKKELDLMLDYKEIENNALEYLKAAKENGDKNAKYLLDEVISQKDGGMSAYQKWLETSADNGDSDSMVILGDNYLTDTMLEKNEQNAIKWYRKAANKGNPDALYNLGVLYQKGKIDGKPNYEEALKLFAKSAKKGKAEAYMKLGIYYYIKAFTNNLDMMKSFDYLSEYHKKRFLGSNSPEDYYATGIFNYHSSDFRARAIMYIEKSARLGYAPALCFLGMINLGEKNYDKSLNFFKTAAEKGDSLSYIMIPDIYRNIFNLPHKAKEWAEKGLANENIPVSVKAALIGTLAYFAAEQGEDYKSYEQALLNLNKEHWAQSALGSLYFYLAEHTEGEVSEKNYSKALYWYKKSSSNDVAYNLGYMYYNKKGLKWHQTIFNRNYKKAYKWYKKSAEETGNSKAQEALGKMYYDGIGVNKNYSKAIEWLRKAGHNNRKEAQYMLGEMYEKGQGAYQNWYESLAWYKKAAGEVYKSAAEELEYKTAQEKEEEYSHNAEFQAKACYKLGEIYEKGNEAVKQDLAEARSWYSKAAAQGHEDAKKALKKMKK